MKRRIYSSYDYSAIINAPSVTEFIDNQYDAYTSLYESYDDSDVSIFVSGVAKLPNNCYSVTISFDLQYYTNGEWVDESSSQTYTYDATTGVLTES